MDIFPNITIGVSPCSISDMPLLKPFDVVMATAFWQAVTMNFGKNLHLFTDFDLLLAFFGDIIDDIF